MGELELVTFLFPCRLDDISLLGMESAECGMTGNDSGLLIDAVHVVDVTMGGIDVSTMTHCTLRCLI